MNLKKTAPLIALAALGLLFAVGRGSSEAPPQTFTPDPAAESAACAFVTTNKPTSWAGIQQGDVGQVEWLGRVAFHRAYGRWPDQANPAEVTRLASLITCVNVKLLPPPPPNNPPPPPGDPVEFPPAQQLPPVAATPTPGRHYAIKAGDTLFEVSSAAYNTQGGTNAARAKLINDAPYNARFRRPIDDLPGLSAQAKTFEKSVFGDTRITFSPIFGAFAEQFADSGDGAQGEGSNFAVIYIPEAP